MSGTGLRARGLGKSYRRRPVVRGVDVELHRGEAVGLLGPNGAGKTTTFYMITGLVQADTGKIEIDGDDVGRAYSEFLHGYNRMPLRVS